MKQFTVFASALLLVCAARDTAAQGFINPFVGTTLTSPSTSGDRSKPGVGIALGKVGNIVGFEIELAYYPELLSNSALAKSRVFTYSANTLIGPTVGRVKPYGAFGVGNLHLNTTSVSSVVTSSPEGISNNYVTFNAGGGVFGFLTSHLGVRGDLRYYRSFGFDFSDIQAGFTLARIDFWRANIGLVAKF